MKSHFAKNEAYYDQSRLEMLAFLPKEAARYLEIGCGNGNFGALVKNQKKGVEYWGVEISKIVARGARGNLDKVILGDFEDGSLDLPKGYFDCVIFNDVLEHFRDPWGALRCARSLMTSGGHIVASIPNVRFFHTLKDLVIHKQWNYAKQGVQDITHLRFFTQSGVRQLFESNGYKITRLEGINGIEFPWKFRIFNAFVMGSFDDSRYLQFACVARIV